MYIKLYGVLLDVTDLDKMSVSTLFHLHFHQFCDVPSGIDQSDVTSLGPI